YCRCTENRSSLAFFLDFDSGTEPFDRVLPTLSGFAPLAAAAGITAPLLFLSSSARRERSLHTRLQLRAALMHVPCATAVAGVDGPEGAIWLPHDRRDGRLRLAQLADHWPQAMADTEGRR